MKRARDWIVIMIIFYSLPAFEKNRVPNGFPNKNSIWGETMRTKIIQVLMTFFITIFTLEGWGYCAENNFVNIADIPGIGRVEFPGDMTNEQITEAIETKVIPQAIDKSWEYEVYFMAQSTESPEDCTIRCIDVEFRAPLLLCNVAKIVRHKSGKITTHGAVFIQTSQVKYIFKQRPWK